MVSHSLNRRLTGVFPFALSGGNNKNNNGIAIQVSVHLLFPPSPSQNNNINHYSVTQDAYKTEMENVLMKSFVSGNFTKLFQKSCLNTCGGNQNTCSLCNRISFSVPSVGGGSYGSSTTLPTSVPTVPSDSITKANGTAAVFSSTTTLIGVVVGGLVMFFLFIWLVLYCYRRVTTDDTTAIALKDIYQVDSSSSIGNISRGKKDGKMKKNKNKNKNKNKKVRENDQEVTDEEYQYSDNPTKTILHIHRVGVSATESSLHVSSPQPLDEVLSSDSDDDDGDHDSNLKSKQKSKLRKPNRPIEYEDNPLASQLKAVPSYRKDVTASGSIPNIENIKLTADSIPTFDEEYGYIDNNDKDRFGYNQFAGASQLRTNQMKNVKPLVARESAASVARVSAVVDWKETYRVPHSDDPNKWDSYSEDSGQSSDSSDSSNKKYKSNPMMKKK